MRALSIVSLLAALAALTAACDRGAASPGAEECQWPPGSPPAAAGTCPPKCTWNGTACEKDRGILVDNIPTPTATAPAPTMTAPAPTVTAPVTRP